MVAVAVVVVVRAGASLHTCCRGGGVGKKPWVVVLNIHLDQSVPRRAEKGAGCYFYRRMCLRSIKSRIQ